MEHGTHSTYVNHGCRCKLCRAANADYHRQYQQRRRAELAREREELANMQDELAYVSGRLSAYEEVA